MKGVWRCGAWRLVAVWRAGVGVRFRAVNESTNERSGLHESAAAAFAECVQIRSNEHDKSTQRI